MLVAGLKAKKSFSLRVIAHNLFHGQRHDMNRFTFSGYLGVHLALARSDGNLSEVDSGRMARPNCDELINRSRSHLLKWLIAEALYVLINPAEHLFKINNILKICILPSFGPPSSKWVLSNTLGLSTLSTNFAIRQNWAVSPKVHHRYSIPWMNTRLLFAKDITTFTSLDEFTHSLHLTTN